MSALIWAYAPELVALGVGLAALVVGDLLDGGTAARDLRAEARERAEALAAIARIHRADDLIPPPTGGWARTPTRQDAR